MNPIHDQALDDVLSRFETAWLNGERPRIDNFLPLNHPYRESSMLELVSIDLECRWREARDNSWTGRTTMIASAATDTSLDNRKGFPECPLLEDYSSQLLDVGPVDQMPLNIIVDEYRVRTRWGDRPSHDEYRSRFSDRSEELSSALAAMDNVLNSESPTTGDSGRRPIEAFSLDLERAEFEKRLIDSDVLTLADLDTTIPHDEDATASEVAERLIETGRLTDFQVRKIASGAGAELVLGQYVLLEPIGEGGMGQVYCARHNRMNRVVALKVIHESIVDSNEAVERFHREVQAAAKLIHPHLVTAFDANEDHGRHFLVMEFVDGMDLASLVKSEGSLRVERAVDLVTQVARGLGFAHDQGIVHRDVKPSNLLIDADGTVKISDLGLVRVEQFDEDVNGLTDSGHMMGTIDYMAPEQALDAKTADARSDIYSLGTTLHFLLTAGTILPGTTMGQKMQMLLSTEANWLPSIDNAGYSNELKTLVRRMCNRDPGERYQNMTEVIRALEAIQQPHVATDSAAEDMLEATKSPDTAFGALEPDTVVLESTSALPLALTGRSKTARWIVAALALALLGGAGWWLSGVIAKLETPHGTLIVESDIPDAKATVDGEEVEVSYSNDGKRLTISLDPGTHKLEVTSPDGLKLKTNSRHVEIDASETTSITARLIRRIETAHTVPPGDPEGPTGLVTAGKAIPGKDVGPCRLVEFLPDGKLLVVYAGEKPLIWDPVKRKRVHTFAGPNNPAGAVISPDASKLAVATDGGQLQIWDIEKRTLDRELGQVWQASEEPLNLVLDFSPDGGKIVIGRQTGSIGEKRVQLHDSVDGRLLEELTYEGRGDGVEFHPNGRWVLVIGGGPGGNSIHRWDTATGAKRTLGACYGPVSLDREGRYLLSSTGPRKDSTLVRIDVETGAAICFDIPGKTASRFALCQNGRLAIVATGQLGLHLWDMKKLEPVQTLEMSGQAASAICISDDGRFAATADLFGTVEIWRLPKLDPTETGWPGAEGYKKLADGTWKQLFDSPESVADTEGSKYSVDGIELTHEVSVEAPIEAQNVLLRSKVKLLSGGPRPRLSVRVSGDNETSAEFVVASGFTLSGAGYWSDRPYQGSNEVTLAAIGNKAALYINGVPVIQKVLSNQESGKIRLGCSFGEALFQDIEVMDLDGSP